MLWRLLTVALLAIGLTTAVACGGDDDDTSGDDAAATTAPAGAATETEPSDGGGGEGATLTLQASDFAFMPDVLTGTGGDAITLTVTNAGSVSHTFTSEGLSIDETVAPGESKVIEFAFPDAETAFICKFHESQMTGALIQR